jgi:hypothetical protein
MIYFARLANGLIKIGTTVHLPARLKGHRHGGTGRLTILGVMDGDRKVERAIHWRFWRLRVGRHEHFKAAPDLLAFVAENCRPPDIFDQLRETDGKRVREAMEYVKEIQAECPKRARKPKEGDK